MKSLIVDGQNVAMKEFIRVNTQDPDVHHISKEEVKLVKSLKAGEHCYIGVVKIEKAKS